MVDNKIIRKSITSITSIVSIISIIGIGILFGSNYDIYSSCYKSNDNEHIKIKDEGEYILITNTDDEHIKIKDEGEYILIANTDDEYHQMNNIIEKAGGLDNDLYGRKISPHVVKKFCHIAKNKSIDLNNITEEQFDTIYRTYTEYLILKYDKKE